MPRLFQELSEELRELRELRRLQGLWGVSQRERDLEQEVQLERERDLERVRARVWARVWELEGEPERVLEPEPKPEPEREPVGMRELAGVLLRQLRELALELELGQERERERERELGLERERDRERKRERQREREQREQERLLRQAQLRQQLEAPPGGLSLNLSSLMFLLVLAALVLELVGWFMFLGLLVTILAYLLLIIAPAATTLHVEPSGLRRDATSSAFMPNVAVHRVASLVTRCMQPRLSAKLFQRI
ncbi:hypothetical protein DFH09DRAFT_1323948 [Mycena vulgaris]|nr:hypothetical protein DFH09DRAFT_1323948 [Mycena vulgaris]